MTTDTQDFSHLRALAAELDMPQIPSKKCQHGSAIAMRQAADTLDALQAEVAQCLKERDAYATALAACRDAFPVPDAGSRLDDWYCSAMADPLEVPEYVKACVGASPAAVTATKPLTYLQRHLQGFTCTKVEDAGGTEKLTLYMTKLGAHSEYQLYGDEALALWINIGKALEPELTSASPVEQLGDADPVCKGRDASGVMARAHALCPTERTHHQRMAWMASYFLANYTKPSQALERVKGERDAMAVDAVRLDYLQTTGSTIDLWPGRPWEFRVSGLLASRSASVREAIDAAIAAQGGKV